MAGINYEEMQRLLAEQATGDGFETELAMTFTAPGYSSIAKLKGQMAFQVTGVATAVSIQLWRSTHDPATSANWAPVLETPLTGNPSTGMTVQGVLEPAVAWWRYQLISITGASVSASLTGRVAL